MRRSSSEARRNVGAECAALSLASVLGSLLLWWLVQRHVAEPLWSLGTTRASESEMFLVTWTVCAETLAFFSVGVLATGVGVWLNKPRGAARIFLICASAVCVFVTLDAQVYAAFGRHAAELARFALLPGAAAVAGGSGHWLALIALWTVLAAAAMIVLTWGSRRVLGWCVSRMSPAFRRVALGLYALILIASLALPGFAQSYYREPALREGLRASLIWAPPAPAAGTMGGYRDPNWTALDAGLRSTYARLFPFIFAQHRRVVTPRAAATRPSVLLFVFESFRADSLTPERMPRLYAWAQRGLFAKQHFAGSTFSEAGMFSLLYGRSPLLYHATLDAHEAPTWCAVAHAFGMTCSYYSGQPQVWMRLEEFLNPRAVDHYVHDDQGDWNQWDRRAVHAAVEGIVSGGERSSISTVYLMSTHFEYQYPPEYERHVPVMTEVKWPKTNMTGIDISNRIPMTNRYLNSLAFSDDLVADAIARLDPTRTLIIVTGDHGESLGDDGRFGHAYSFADAIARVPLVIVGPGVPATTRESPSLHADLLRTIVHALGGDATGPAESEDLLAPTPPRSGLLLAHCSFDHDTADALLIHGDRRIRLELGLHAPDVKIRGPENALGRPSDTYALSAEQARGLLETFETSLNGLWQTGSAPSATP